MELLDCLKRERDISIKAMSSGGKMAFRLSPPLRVRPAWPKKKEKAGTLLNRKNLNCVTLITNSPIYFFGIKNNGSSITVIVTGGHVSVNKVSFPGHEN